MSQGKYQQRLLQQWGRTKQYEHLPAQSNSANISEPQAGPVAPLARTGEQRTSLHLAQPAGEVREEVRLRLQFCHQPASRRHGCDSPGQQINSQSNKGAGMPLEVMTVFSAKFLGVVVLPYETTSFSVCWSFKTLRSFQVNTEGFSLIIFSSKTELLPVGKRRLRPEDFLDTRIRLWGSL